MKPNLGAALSVMSCVATVLLVVAAPSAGAARAHTGQLSPPVITEPFTPLPCAGAPGTRSTIEQEGCAEHQILRTDTKIDALNGTVFATLRSDGARRHFIAANAAWLGYRKKYCLSVSDVFAGGTQAPVLDAQCTAGLNSEHIKDLSQFAHDLGAD